MKKTLRYISLTILSLLALYWAFTIVLSLPPAQRFIMEKVNSRLSSHGLELQAGNIRLSFPCKVELNGFVLKKEGKECITGESLRADIRPIALLNGEMSLNSMAATGIEAHDANPIGKIVIDGTAGNISVTGCSFNKEKNLLAMKHTDVDDCDISIFLERMTRERYEMIMTMLDLYGADIEPGTISVTNSNFAVGYINGNEMSRNHIKSLDIEPGRITVRQMRQILKLIYAKEK